MIVACTKNSGYSIDIEFTRLIFGLLPFGDILNNSSLNISKERQADMSHTSLKSGYTELVERLNRFPQGAPPSETLYKILEILFSQREAELVALLPIKPFTAEKASQVWKMDLAETQKVSG